MSKKQTGEFVSGVDITIDDSSGAKIFEAEDMGPIFLAKLVPGTYKVKAKLENEEQVKSVTIRHNSLRELYFYW